MVKVNRTVLDKAVPNIILFKDGGHVRTRLDFFEESNGDVFKYVGEIPYTVPPNSDVSTNGGLYSSKNPNGKWVRVLNSYINSSDIVVQEQVLSIAALLNYPAKHGTVVYVQSYLDTSKYGGGTFVFNSIGLKSTHNGGTVISPTVPFTNSELVNTINFIKGVGESDPSGVGVWELMHLGYVSVEQFGVRSSELDQTELVHAALSTGLNIVHEEVGCTIGYRPAVLYTRAGQSLTGLGTGNTKYKMVSGLTVQGMNGYCFEKESGSVIKDLEIDGNAVAYKTVLNTLVPFDNSPEIGGVFTSRFYTNGGRYIRGFHSYDDSLYIHNTIRTCYVMSGTLNTAGKLHLGNSYVDHWLYFSQARQCKIEYVYGFGSFREECVVYGTGSEAPAIDCSVQRMIIDNPVNSQYPTNNTQMRYVHFRQVQSFLPYALNSVQELIIKHEQSTGASQEVNRQIAFGENSRVHIGVLSVSTFKLDGTILLNNSNGSVSIGRCSVTYVGTGSGTGTSFDTVYSRKLSGFTHPSISVNVLEVASDVALPATARIITNNSSSITVNSYTQHVQGGTLVRALGTVGDSCTTVGTITDVVPSVTVSATNSVGKCYFVGAGSRTVQSSSNTPTVHWDNTVVCTGDTTQGITGFTGTVSGRVVHVLFNGSASIANNQNVHLKGGASVRPKAGTCMTLRCIDDVWYEV